MPRLLITKDGENETVESPEMSEAACEGQERHVQAVIDRLDPDHEEYSKIAEVVDLGWVQLSSHVLKGVETVDVETVAGAE